MVGGGPSLVVIPSSILSSATQMHDVELSPNEGSEEILEDSDDELAMKTRISFSEDTSDKVLDIEAIDISSLPLPPLLFLLFLLLYMHFIFDVFPSIPCMSSYYAVIEALKEPKVVDVSIAPTPVEATSFFTHFEQVERNDLNLVDFWGTGPPYVDSMDTGYLKIAWSIRRLFIVTMRILCRNSPSTILLESISSSCWDVL